VPLIGYARVSTEDQNLGPQLDALRAAGCAEVFEEFASGASRARPQLAATLTRVRRGDTLVVARIDRLAVDPLPEAVQLPPAGRPPPKSAPGYSPEPADAAHPHHLSTRESGFPAQGRTFPAQQRSFRSNPDG
jgi:hypothetical protein